MAIGTLGAIALGGSALLGLGSSYMSSKSASSTASSATDAASAATRYGVDAQMDMFNQSMEKFKPFYNAGLGALSKMQKLPTGAEAPTMPSPDINFEFDPENESYKIQKEDFTKSMNQQFAGRGMYNSSNALNNLSEGYRRLQAAEEDKQYGRAVDQYGRESSSAMDKFNIENKLAQQDMNRQRDIVQLGSGAASSMGQAAGQTGSSVASSYNALANTQYQGNIAQGQAQQGMWQDIGALPTNAMAQYYYGKKALG